MSEVQKLSIFWDESSIYLLVYASYALLVCTVFCLLEVRLARAAGTAFSRLVLHSASLALLASCLFALSLLVSGWYAARLGGEIAAFVVSLAVMLLALYFHQAWSIGRLTPGHRSARLASVVAAALLAAPYAGGGLLFLLLASGMRN